MEIDNIVLLRLQAGSIDDIKDVLKNITEKNSQRFKFEELNESDRRSKLWSLLFHHLNKSSSAGCHKGCLSTIRMLSRDDTNLDAMIDERYVDTLLMQAGLYQQDQLHDISDKQDEQHKYETIIEAQKALCNLLFNSSKVQTICSCNRTIESVVTRLRLFNEPTLPHDVKIFDIKILFLITALSPAARDQQVAIVVEVLKVLFNIMLKSTTTPQLAHDEDDTAQFMKLQLILKSMLLCKTTPPQLIQSLHNHVVNLLTLAPNACHRELISIISPNDTPRGHEFNGKNMEAVAVLIDFLDKRLNQVKNGQCSDTETLCPILTVLIECAKSDSQLRKYVRAQVLPPLRDVTTRPEQGDKLRNKLCRLLTCPVTNVRDLVAELLFVLCKESVARMIKYTGYGNAAGMFADRGLLGCSRQGGSAPYYSSDSDDSETEEYSAYKDRINPILGCYEPAKPDPTNGMTEEQKEYEALRLANMMDKLARDGLIQPCRIGEDGRPEPVEHVLQLAESSNGLVKKSHFNNSSHHSDED
ncbi:synembryn-A [Nilaparvata lugens]|uniref:synembryn-A n=1 Tax=Nilaparvata lugens TaxID=108931 RepID=UPI00193D46BB|nr:synembryn-A [Nilaparvata lugens]